MTAVIAEHKYERVVARVIVFLQFSYIIKGNN
jgi:hypothetical protein